MKEQKERFSVRQLTVIALLAALAYACVFFRIPIGGFLTYDPKDAVIAIGGFLYGPLTALLLSVLVSFLEFLTVSDSGWIGLLMNVIASCFFVLPAAFLYRKRRTLGGAVCGLLFGVFLMTAGMLLWNYLITPLYTGLPRAEVVGLILPLLLPFNLLKACINAALTVVLYKSVVTALRKARLVPPSSEKSTERPHMAYWFIGLFILVTLILIVLVWQKVL